MNDLIRLAIDLAIAIQHGHAGVTATAMHSNYGQQAPDVFTFDAFASALNRFADIAGGKGVTGGGYVGTATTAGIADALTVRLMLSGRDDVEILETPNMYRRIARKA